MVSVPLTAGAEHHRRAERLPAAPRPVAASASSRCCGFFGEHAASAIRTAQLIERQTRQVDALARLVRGLREQTHEHANQPARRPRPARARRARRGAAVRRASSRPRTTSPTAASRARSSQHVVAGLLLAETAVAQQRGIALEIDDASRLDRLPPRLTDADAVTIIGNLLENAFDAVARLAPGAPARAAERSSTTARTLTIRVADRGAGVRTSSAATGARRLDQGRATPGVGPRAGPRRRRGGRRHALRRIRRAAEYVHGVDPDGEVLEMAAWRTVIVEDSPAVADVHRRLVALVPGFVIAGERGAPAPRRGASSRCTARTCCCSTSGSPTATGSRCCARCAARATRSR